MRTSNQIENFLDQPVQVQVWAVRWDVGYKKYVAYTPSEAEAEDIKKAMDNVWGQGFAKVEAVNTDDNGGG